jgi:nicotinamidase-related amidase
MKIDLLLIDPQRDFCDSNGSLYVKNAEKDMNRLGNMLNRLITQISNIHVTLDSHHCFDIAHPCFFKNKDGRMPDPFTIISAEDVENEKWIPCNPLLIEQTIHYLKTLKEKGRYPHCIWPQHCLIGSYGASIYPTIFQALMHWEYANMKTIDMIYKGSNPMTEHFSAIKAEVSDLTDPSTLLNLKLINELSNADIILVAGEAGSHCVANSIKDLVNEFNNTNIKKIILLEDAMSPVTGFETVQEDFIKEMVSKGVQLNTTMEFLK